MTPSNLLIETLDRVTRITVNRPASLNALNSQTVQELHHAIEQAAADDDVRAVIITGAGEKAFVAGADISEIRELDNAAARQFVQLGQDTMNRIQNLGKPVIAAVNGYALGGGCELALACTLRIASDNALIGLPEISLGILPGFGGTQRLPRIVGSGRGLELMLTGKPVGAQQALEWGLFNRVVAQDELLDTAHTLAKQLARSAPIAVNGILKAVNDGIDLPLEDGLAIEIDEFLRLCETEDMREGTSAFLEKRRAEFKGR